MNNFWCSTTSMCDALSDLIPSVQLKKAKNTHGEVLLLVKLQASAFSKSISLHSPMGVFHVFQNCTNGSKSRRASPQSAFTCSKLTIETLEQGVKYVQS